jgi:glucose 1-dehydrogenase
MEKTAVVTGGASGIGRKITEKLFCEGYNVVIADNDIHTAEVLAADLSTSGKGRLLPVYTDVSVESSVAEMVRQTLAGFKTIDVLVHCAAVQKPLAFEDLTYDEWKRVIDVNLNGTFLCCKYISAEMVKNKAGKIVNLTSIHDRVPRLNKFNYDASKAAVSMFTKELALQLAPYRINVNAVAPGAIKTPMNDSILSNSDQQKEVESRIPWKRMGDAEEVAELVSFLVSSKADYITGEIIAIDGGRSLI